MNAGISGRNIGDAQNPSICVPSFTLIYIVQDIDVSILRTLYLALVRSQLEYCSVVWSPHTSRNVSKLERIQRRATKSILKTNDDYEQQRKKLNLLSLEQRRVLFDVLFLYKVLNGYINIDPSTYVQFFSDSDYS